MGVREWATRRLRSGDLSALAALASGAGSHDHERVERLIARGFLVRQGQRLTVTARGRLALLIRRLTMH